MPPFPQTTGVAQGDNLSPMLFSVLLSDLPRATAEKHDLVSTILDADDAVLFSRSRRQLQKSMRTLEEYSAGNDLVINAGKTKAMKFGRGGLPAAGDVFKLSEGTIEKVSSFCYLGVELNSRGLSFSKHLESRVKRARMALGSIPKPHDLSLATALTLFDIKILPIVAYGIEITWEHMTANQPEELDKLKASYIKLALHACHATSD